MVEAADISVEKEELLEKTSGEIPPLIHYLGTC